MKKFLIWTGIFTVFAILVGVLVITLDIEGKEATKKTFHSVENNSQIDDIIKHSENDLKLVSTLDDFGTIDTSDSR